MVTEEHDLVCRKRTDAFGVQGIEPHTSPQMVQVTCAVLVTFLRLRYFHIFLENTIYPLKKKGILVFLTASIPSSAPSSPVFWTPATPAKPLLLAPGPFGYFPVAFQLPSSSSTSTGALARREASRERGQPRPVVLPPLTGTKPAWHAAGFYYYLFIYYLIIFYLFIYLLFLE